MKLLDFGCGDGGFQEIAQDRLSCRSWLALHGGNDAYGLDHNPDKIKVASCRIVNGTAFIVSDGHNTPFANNSFDHIHVWGVLHHMGRWGLAVKEIARILDTGGVLEITESVDNDLVFRICRRVWGSWQGDKIDSYFTSAELDAALSNHFTIVQRKYYWRFVLSDVLRSYKKEPKWSLYINHAISMFLTRVGLDKQFCCHYSVWAIKNG